RQAVPGFEHVHLEIVLVAFEGDADRGVQVPGENRNCETLRDDNVFALARTVERRVCRATPQRGRVTFNVRKADRREAEAGKGKRRGDRGQSWESGMLYYDNSLHGSSFWFRPDSLVFERVTWRSRMWKAWDRGYLRRHDDHHPASS